VLSSNVCSNGVDLPPTEIRYHLRLARLFSSMSRSNIEDVGDLISEVILHHATDEKLQQSKARFAADLAVERPAGNRIMNAIYDSFRSKQYITSYELLKSRLRYFCVFVYSLSQDSSFPPISWMATFSSPVRSAQLFSKAPGRKFVSSHICWS
jgi:hypothetical protein